MFTDTGETTTQETKRKQFLKAQFEKDLLDADCIGLHGTSIEALEFVIKNGYLPGSVSSTSPLNKGDFFFNPRKGFFPGNLIQDSVCLPDNEIENETSDYSAHIARSHFILKTLALDFSNPVHYSDAIIMTADFPGKEERQIIDKYRDRAMQIAYKPIEGIIEEAEQRKGFVMGINRSAITIYGQPTKGDDIEDLKFNCSHGFVYTNIHGLKPQGPTEIAYIRSLK